MEAVGQLTGGLAHDLTTCSPACSATSSFWKPGSAPTRGRASWYKRPPDGAARGAQLTEQLLVFARKQHLEPKATDLNAAVRAYDRHAAADHRRRAGSGQDRRSPAISGPPWSMRRRSKSRSSIWPSMRAMPCRSAAPSGSHAQCRGGSSSRPSDLTPGDYVAVTVADTGEGMSEEVLEKAFEPFFHNQGAGQGDGAGALTGVWVWRANPGARPTSRASPGRHGGENLLATGRCRQ